MNRKQYLILCRSRKEASKAEATARKLKLINEDPHQQYDWDAWMQAEGLASGLRRGVLRLEAFIAAGKTKTGAS